LPGTIGVPPRFHESITMKREQRRPSPRSALPFAGTVVVAVLAAMALLGTDLTLQAADSLSYLPESAWQVLPARLFE